MRRLIENISDRTEFWLVITIAFGLFITGSAIAFITHRPRVFSDSSALFLVLFEASALALVAAIARIRHWSWKSLGFKANWRLTIAGILLFFAGNLTIGIVYSVASAFYGRDIPRTEMTGSALTWIGIILISIVNPLFEEALVTGYVIRALSHEGAALAITASALLRFLYHTYQGPIAAVCILPLGLIFAIVYWRFRELWPLIVAHALMDIIALSRIALG